MNNPSINAYVIYKKFYALFDLETEATFNYDKEVLEWGNLNKESIDLFNNL